MIKSKKEYRCGECEKKHIKWQGYCSSCKKAGTLKEVVLIDPKVKASPSQRSLQRRSKTSERNIAKRMVAADGPDPNFQHIATSTGRIGHITNIRVDAISAHYVTENKNRTLPVWLIDAWLLINQRAVDFNRNALLHLDPPNMPKEMLINGTKQKLSTLSIISQDRHESLIQKEKVLADIEQILSEDINAAQQLRLVKEKFGL